MTLLLVIDGWCWRCGAGETGTRACRKRSARTWRRRRDALTQADHSQSLSELELLAADLRLRLRCGIDWSWARCGGWCSMLMISKNLAQTYSQRVCCIVRFIRAYDECHMHVWFTNNICIIHVNQAMVHWIQLNLIPVETRKHCIGPSPKIRVAICVKKRHHRMHFLSSKCAKLFAPGALPPDLRREALTRLCTLCS